MDLTKLPVESPGLLGVGHDDLVDQKLADDVLIDRVLLELKVVVVHWGALNDLIVVLGIVDLLEEGMLQNLSRRKSFSGIVGEELGEKVQRCWRSLGNHLGPGLARNFIRDFLHVLEVFVRSDLLLDCLRGHTHNLQ